MPRKKGSPTVNNRVKKPRGKGKRFQKNDPATGFKDERINRKGPPPMVRAINAEVRELAQRLLNEKLPVKQEGKITGEMPVIENLFRLWILSHDFQKQNRVVEWAAGKIPDEVIVNSDVENFVKQNIHLFTDGQIERLGRGESVWVILGELLNDALKKKQEQ